MSYIKNIEEYNRKYQESIEDPEAFWTGIADSFTWKEKWNKVLDWNFTEPNVKWFEGGKLNITENCLDRHLQARGDKAAIVWEPNDPKEPVVTYTYKELHQEVCRASNMLKNLGVKKGDRVCLYMPMVPELAISVLACARIGAIHSVVFAGFSANSLADRINDATCSIVITSDGLYRGAKQICLKDIVDEALTSCASVEHVLVLKRTGEDVQWNDSVDKWWHESIEGVSSIALPKSWMQKIPCSSCTHRVRPENQRV